MQKFVLSVLYLGLGAVGLPGQSAASSPARPARPSGGDREAWMRHVEPSPVELSWDQIPWQPTFGDGLLAANQKRRPLLLYAMNGHPLGNT